jgi:transposase
MSLLDSTTKIKICYSLWKNNVSPEVMPNQLNIHRATVYRWINKFQKMNLGRFLLEYERAKHGRRRKLKTPISTKLLIYEIRKKYRNC